jgi:nucleoside-diphosphate-sugar epimerase
MTRIILLGSGGFIGKSLLPKLTLEGFSVKPMIHSNSINHIDEIHGDILDSTILDSILNENDVVVNLIGQYTNNDSGFIDINIKGGFNLLNSCVKNNVKKIILVSSINVYGNSLNDPSNEESELNPQTNYGLIKLLTEKLYQDFSKIYNLDITILRMSNLYGPNKKVGYISYLINSAVHPTQNIVAYNNGNQLRDILFIDDAIDGIIKSIKKSMTGFNIFNISSGFKYSINEIIEEIENVSNQKLNIDYSKEIPDEICIWANNSKAKSVLGFNPVISLQEGLKITINNLKNI